MSLPIENWKPVVGYEGYYEVSDHGRVRSVDRVVQTERGPWRYPGRILSQHTDPIGRKRVGLSVARAAKNVKVHTLVLTAFVGPRPPRMEGCHNNGNASDNRLTNLRWDTSSANNLDIVRHGRHNEARKTHCKRGHELVLPNLVARTRGRICLACARARDARRFKPHAGAEVQTLSDTFYKRIMESTRAEHSRTG